MPIASGANPVASASGNRTRRDPGAAVRTYHEGLNLTPRTGTFYFGGNRNFLLWSDTASTSSNPFNLDGKRPTRGSELACGPNSFQSRNRLVVTNLPAGTSEHRRRGHRVALPMWPGPSASQTDLCQRPRFRGRPE